MTPKEWVEIIAALTGPIGLVGLILHRIIRDYGFGARATQFAAIILIIPTILILGLEKALDGAGLATLIASVAGYVLWKVGEFGTEKKSTKGETGQSDKDATTDV